MGSEPTRDYAESIRALPCDPYQVVEVDCVTPVVWEVNTEFSEHVIEQHKRLWNVRQK